MSDNENVFTPGPTPNTVRDRQGNVRTVPTGWSLLPPGDAALTRRVKVAGPHWSIQQRRGRRVFSQGLWAPTATIQQIQAELNEERGTETYQRRRKADAQRREQKQAEYVDQFAEAVFAYLNFHRSHEALALRLASEVASHATPVGSGTVARTQRIPIERRAEAAVIAWLRHQTTGYDSMYIPQLKGKRREVRRMLAERSKELLDSYRRGETISKACPLWRVLSQAPSTAGQDRTK